MLGCKAQIAEEAKKLIDESGLKVESVILLQEAADKVAEILFLEKVKINVFYNFSLDVGVTDWSEKTFF